MIFEYTSVVTVWVAAVILQLLNTIWALCWSVAAKTCSYYIE